MSRLRSTRSSGAASGSSARAAAGRGPRVAVAVPKSDVFVVMLGIALGAVVLGCLLLLGVLWRHDFSVSVSSISNSAAPESPGYGLPKIPLIS